MSGFTPSGLGVTGLDPTKRVNYRLGLVLGEDEFRQDQYHLRERDQYATRALHGYGTVSGLGVRYDEGTARLHVRAGLAVDPAGRLICVPEEYCGSLEEWVAGTISPDDISGGLPPSLSVYVLLCWTECETDEVPIPSGSCLSAEDSRAASRLKDSFELKLSLEPPPVVGEPAPTSMGDDLRDLVDQLHGLLDVSGGSPPDAVGVAALLREWAVDRRPEVAADRACLPVPDETCVLLARVDVTIDAAGDGVQVAAADVDDRERPILVSTRFLQEALFSVAADEEAPDHEHALADLSDVDLSSPPEADDGLVFDGASWVAGRPGVQDHGLLTGRGDDDHPQYLLADGTRGLSGDLSAGNNRLLDLPGSTANGQPIVHGQGAGGDLRGSYPAPVVVRIQGRPVADSAPSVRDTLLFREIADPRPAGRARWEPGMPWVLPLATIEPLGDDRQQYVVWLNLDAPENRVEVDEASFREALEVHREVGASRAPSSFLVQVGPDPNSFRRLARNVFQVGVSENAPLLRFTFTLEALRLVDGSTVDAWARAQGIWFAGQAAKQGQVTVCVLKPDAPFPDGD